MNHPLACGLKISHFSVRVIEDILEKLSERFGKEDPLTITRGKVHDYLGMTFDYSTTGKVAITMQDYIERMLDDLPQDMNGTAATPAASHLFDVNPGAVRLDHNTADLFHTTVAKLLFLCKRARPDIHTAVAFLTTRVASPDTDDYAKLRRCVRYLRGTAGLPLTLEGDPCGKIQWWVDASFAVHPDMKSHTGAIMTLGQGATFSMSTRQRLNTKSSTEAELVGVDDALPQIVWTRNFLQAQGLKVQDNVVYQDNQSAILLERNGRRSSGKRTRHINNRYFMITDRIAQKEMRVEYCNTTQMVGDLFTKPLQGSLFRRLRDIVLNVQPRLDSIAANESQECVETSDVCADIEVRQTSNGPDPQGRERNGNDTCPSIKPTQRKPMSAGARSTSAHRNQGDK